MGHPQINQSGTSIDQPLESIQDSHNSAEQQQSEEANSGQPQEFPVPHDVQSTVTLYRTEDRAQAVEEALQRAEQGQQVLWIENTVAEAQELYQLLAARACELGIACGLLHSRFTPLHRQQHEQRWVNLFGKAGWSERHVRGRILVGTQVLEQSLDIDADFLVSAFAPTDMLLQRLGQRQKRQKKTHTLTQFPPQIMDVLNSSYKKWMSYTFATNNGCPQFPHIVFFKRWMSSIHQKVDVLNSLIAYPSF